MLPLFYIFRLYFDRFLLIKDLILTSACAAAESEEQVFIQAVLSLATWSTELGVYLVISGVQTVGLTGAPAPHPGPPMSGLMLVTPPYPFCSLQSSLLLKFKGELLGFHKEHEKCFGFCNVE